MNTRIQSALSSLPPPGQGYHPRLMGVANTLAWAGVSADDAFQAIRSHTPRGNRPVPDSEIRDAIQKALAEADTQRNATLAWQPKPAKPKLTVDATVFWTGLQKQAEGATEADLWEASPIRIDWKPEQDTFEILRRLYEPGDVLFLGDRYDTNVKPVKQWLADFKSGKPVPPHIIPNPLTGKQGTTKTGKESYRADDCVAGYRYAVVEFDNMTREKQIVFWSAIDLPVVAVIDSGGKSLHGWVRVDADDETQWSEQVEDKLFVQWLVPLGCDSACRNEARLSRLPGHFRAEKKRWQRILYLSPEGSRQKC